MANKEHLNLIKRGVKAWNEWRSNNPNVWPDLNSADLTGAQLAYADLDATDLRNSELVNANLGHAQLNETKLSRADLTGASLYEAQLWSADLQGADLRHANLSEADLRSANLDEANCEYCDFSGANLTGASLINTNMRLVTVGWTIFGHNDLRTVVGLDTIDHIGPSTLGIDTLYESEGDIPEAFLREVGIPDDFITFIPSLVARPIEFYSCFISYSHQDEEFSRSLHSRMRSENLRVWYAPEDMKAGRKLHEEIFRAIQIHDKLLLVLSENSMKSEWVMTEIRRAKKVERDENRRKLFPIRLVDFETIQKWECFDADSGKDLAVEVREYYIPDFSNWTNHDSFESEFAKLLRDLRATEN
jgi:hypothetical protein